MKILSLVARERQSLEHLFIYHILACQQLQWSRRCQNVLKELRKRKPRFGVTSRGHATPKSLRRTYIKLQLEPFLNSRPTKIQRSFNFLFPGDLEKLMECICREIIEKVDGWAFYVFAFSIRVARTFEPSLARA